MMQGGDPTGTGHGGESAWGKPFDDEFAPGLSHDARGILSMANKGTNTNQSQFFITFRPCKYLDKKHSIFGRVVGGQDTLISIEKVETDGSDMPKDPVYFMRAEVFVDPFEEAEAEVQKERAELLSKDAQKEAAAKKEAASKPKAFGTGVGKYINPQSKRPAGDALPSVPALKKKIV
ncbi:peptidyl-prolyl cis-trans isomerase, cyclophilin-type, partial [Oesophagostomum dentatum]